jgi:hypothetical protein
MINLRTAVDVHPGSEGYFAPGERSTHWLFKSSRPSHDARYDSESHLDVRERRATTIWSEMALYSITYPADISASLDLGPVAHPHRLLDMSLHSDLAKVGRRGLPVPIDRSAMTAPGVRDTALRQFDLLQAPVYTRVG